VEICEFNNLLHLDLHPCSWLREADESCGGVVGAIIVVAMVIVVVVVVMLVLAMVAGRGPDLG